MTYASCARRRSVLHYITPSGFNQARFVNDGWSTAAGDDLARNDYRISIRPIPNLPSARRRLLSIAKSTAGLPSRGSRIAIPMT